MKECEILLCLFVGSAPFSLAWGRSRASPPPAPAPPAFSDVAVSAGLTFHQTIGDYALTNIVESTGVGCGFLDYDGDGWLDVYLVNGCWREGISDPNLDAKERARLFAASAGLFRNQGDGTFRDVTRQAGLVLPGYGMGVVAADYDADGDTDLFVTQYGPNRCYRNNGDGTFTSVGQELGVDDTGWTLDVGAADYDNDGDQDLALANDFGQDRIYRTNADYTFTDVTDDAIGWDTHKGMNVDFGDYNNDGWLDLYVTNIWTKEYVKEGNQLYRNMGDGTFSDISFEAGVYDAGWCWAGRFWDYDNDGDLDIIVANGYISGNPEDEYFTKLATTVTKPGFDPIDARNWPPMGDSTFSGYEPSRVWRNEGNEVFVEVARKLGLNDAGDGRGLAIADFDNDGDLDVYISNQGQDGVLYRNDLYTGHHWLQVELTGTNCNRDAIGTRVTVTTRDSTQIREMEGGDGDHSQEPYRLHFALGPHQQVDVIEIRWPTGYVEKHENVQADRLIRYVENTPSSFLEERKRWREVQLEAWERERERERKRAESAFQAEEEEPIEWDRLADFKREYLKYKRAVQSDP